MFVHDKKNSQLSTFQISMKQKLLWLRVIIHMRSADHTRSNSGKEKKYNFVCAFVFQGKTWFCPKEVVVGSVCVDYFFDMTLLPTGGTYWVSQRAFCPCGYNDSDTIH